MLLCSVSGMLQTQLLLKPKQNLNCAFADDGESWNHIVSLDDELSSSAVRIHYPCMLQVKDENRILVVYTRFYLGRKMGLTSPDQVCLQHQELLEEKSPKKATGH